MSRDVKTLVLPRQKIDSIQERGRKTMIVSKQITNGDGTPEGKLQKPPGTRSCLARGRREICTDGQEEGPGNGTAQMEGHPHHARVR